MSESLEQKTVKHRGNVLVVVTQSHAWKQQEREAAVQRKEKEARVSTDNAEDRGCSKALPGEQETESSINENFDRGPGDHCISTARRIWSRWHFS